jgi:20S proteasome alpha/beta subunit
METINKGDPVVALKTNNGIFIATGKSQNSSIYSDCQFSDKIFLLEENIFCVISGSFPDAHVLIDHARNQAQLFKKNFQEIIPIKRILDIICDVKQSFTQTGGKRPFGTSLLIIGFDPDDGYQIYRTEPSGNFSKWNAVASGSNCVQNQNILDKEFKIGLSTEESLRIVIKLFYKKIKNHKISRSVEIFVLKSDDKQRIVFNCLRSSEVDSLIKA